MKKKISGIISVLMVVFMVAGIIVPGTTIKSSAAVSWYTITESGNKGFKELREALEGNTYTYIKLGKTIKADTGFNTHYDSIKITSPKVLDLDGHSIVMDNNGNATRAKILAGPDCYSPNTVADNSNSTLIEINDDGYGGSCGSLTVMNSGLSYDEDSPMDDKTPCIMHTGFYVGNPEDKFSKHFNNVCIRNVFDVVNGSLTIDGNFAVVAGDTKEQDIGSKDESIVNAVSSSIGFAMNVAQTVVAFTAGGSAGASQAGGNAGTSSSNSGAQTQSADAAANAPSDLSSSGSSSGSEQSGSQQSGQQQKSGNTVQASLTGLVDKDTTTLNNFVDALYEATKPLDKCTQIIWGTCINVGAEASVVINGGEFYGHGQSDTERDAVISGAANSVIQINDGEFYGMSGADILNVDVNSNTTIRRGTFECFNETVVRLTDIDNHTTIYPGTKGATGISSDMLDGSLLADGRIMIKAKVLPASALTAERNALQTLASSADAGAANTLQSQANLVKSMVVNKNTTTGKYEIMDGVCLPLSSFVEICPSYGTTSGCTNSLWMENSNGETGTIEYSNHNSSVIHIYGTDYFSNSYLSKTSDFGGATRKTSGVICSEEINPITKQAYKVIKSKNVDGSVQSFDLYDYCPDANKTYIITYTRTDTISIPGSSDKYITDVASTSMTVKSRNGSNAYYEKLSFTTNPSTQGNAVVNLDAVDLNTKYNSSSVFSVTYQWFANGTKVGTTSSNTFNFASYVGKNVYCIATINLTTVGKHLYSNFSTLYAKTETVAVTSNSVKPVIVEQSGDQTVPSYRTPDQLNIYVLRDGNKLFGYEWKYRTSDKNAWKSVSDSGLTVSANISLLQNDGKTGAGTGTANTTGKASYVQDSSFFMSNTSASYLIYLNVSNLQANTDYQFRCEITNGTYTTYSKVMKIRYTDQVTVGPNDVYSGEKTNYDGISYSDSTKTLILDNADESITTEKLIFKRNYSNGVWNSSSNGNSAIISTLDVLNVELKGDNYIDVEEVYDVSTFLYSTGKVVFKGDGNLTVTFKKKNFVNSIDCICAKNVEFSNTGKIKFVIDDCSDYTGGNSEESLSWQDASKFNKCYGVAADSVTINSGTLEFSMLHTATLTRLKFENIFVKFNNLINTTSGVVSVTYPTSGIAPRMYYGSSEKSVNKVDGSYNTNYRNKIYSTYRYDYAKIVMLTEAQKKLDNGCSHVADDYIYTENLVEATCTAAGSCDYVTYCSKCNTEMLRKSAILSIEPHAKINGVVTKAATTSEDGVMSYTCTCNAVTTEAIPKIASISLSKTAFEYNANVQKPTVTVKDSKGNTLVNNTDYTLTYSSGCKDVGTYNVTIAFKGKYSGSTLRTFKITKSSVNVPANVTGGKTSTTTSNSVILLWNKVTGATGYKIYTYNISTKKYTVYKTVLSNSVTLTGLSAASRYDFYIKAYVGSNSGYVTSNGYHLIQVMTKPADISGLTYTASTDSVTLTWNTVAKATGYKIYTYNATTKTYSVYKVVSTNSIKISGLTVGKTYNYYVKAYRTSGSFTAASRNYQKIQVALKPANVTGGKTSTTTSNSVILLWNKVTGATGYKIYTYNTTTKKYSVYKTVTSNSVTLTGLLTATRYDFYIKAYVGNNSGYITSNGYHLIQVMTKPANITGAKVSASTKNSVTLTWDTVSKATGYKIYTYNSSTKTYSVYKVVSTNSVTITGLSAGKTYNYYVKAYRTSGSYTAASRDYQLIKATTKS